MTAPIIVHHLNNSRSQRILFLFEELNLPYEIKVYQRGADMLAPKELKEVHPLGHSPVITDNGRTVAESGAILEYVVNTKPGGEKLVPTDLDLKTKYWELLHMVEGSLMPWMLMSLIFSVGPSRAPFLIRPLVKAIFGGVNSSLAVPNINNMLNYFEKELGDKEYFLGEFSAVDVQMSFPIEAATMPPRKLITESSYPKLHAWIKRIHERPAYKRALEKGPEYIYAKM